MTQSSQSPVAVGRVAATDHAWLTSWDDKMVKLLQTIANGKHPPKLQMLFFANTFPLAYHYAVALKNNGKKDFRPYIQLAKWGSRKAKNVISYTSEADRNLSDSAHISVTIFRPRWAFVPLTLGTHRIWESLKPESEKLDIHGRKARKLSDFLKKIKLINFHRISIYAELKELGSHLRTLIEREAASLEIEAFAPQGLGSSLDLPILSTRRSRENLLQLFIYGGSLSSYLYRKTTRYLPLTLDDDGNNGSSLTTFLACPKSAEGALRTYHKKLYKDAENPAKDRGQCAPFFTVYRSYNDMAWLLQHRSSFEDAEEFARCLTDHHREPS